MIKNKLRWNVQSLFVAVIALFSFSIDFSSKSIAFVFPGWYEILAIILATVLVPYVHSWNWTEILLSALYSFFLLVGRAFFKYEWEEPIPFNHGEPIIKWLIALPGFFAVCFPIVHYVFEYVQGKGRNWTDSSDRIDCLDKYPLLIPFMLSLFLQTVSYICCFPGIMIPGDNVYQIAQFTETFIDGNASLTAHHPIMHTLVLGGFIWGGKLLLGSETVGYGLYTAAQLIVNAICFAKAMCFLKEMRISAKIRIGLIVFYGLNPIFSNMLNVSTKDIWYASFLLTFIIEIIKKLHNKKNDVFLFLTGVLCILSRNEGIYIVLIPVVSFLLIKKCRKCGIVISTLFILSHLFMVNILLPGFNILPVNKRESLSLPMQTMARYIIGHYGEWTNEEEKIISQVLDIENLEGWYNPNSVDSIKFISNTNAKHELTDEDVKQFLKVWIKFGIKHPLSYFDALLEMKNQYLYAANTTGITRVSPNLLTTENSKYSFFSLQNYHLNIVYPEKLKDARQMFENIRTRACMLPIIRLFCISPTYTWLALLMIFFFLKQRETEVLPLTFMTAVMVLVLFATPLDGHDFRYSFPLAYVLPFSGLLNLKLMYSYVSGSVQKDGRMLN